MWDKVVENGKWIAIKTEKTGEPVRIPLTKKIQGSDPRKVV
jgi:hypothetical protein